MCQFRNRSPDERATAPLDFVHCDLAGPIDPVGRDGFKYALSFVDDYSGIIMVYFLKCKSDTPEALQQFLADAAPFGRNGTVERAWLSLFNMARCLLLEANLPKSIWTYAVMAAAYIRNRCFNARLGKTPYEAFTGSKPDLSNMHVFGFVCYAYVQNAKKLDPRSKQGIFVGYDKRSPAYLVFYPDSNKVERVRCVKFFNESNHESKVNPDEQEGEFLPSKVSVPIANESVISTQGDESANGTETVHDEVQYPSQTRTKPTYLNEYVTGKVVDDAATCAVDYCYRTHDIPTSYSQAVHSPERNKWEKAMDDEIEALESNENFELVPPPKGCEVVGGGGKWVYTIKIGPDKAETYKARYVAKGYSQIPDIDYHETFSPTARMSSIHVLLQQAIQNDMLVHQMDVKTAYLNGAIDCEIFIDQPEGYERVGQNGERLVCKLNKSLYGLKQSGRNWNMLHDYLMKESFTQSLADPCVYIRNGGTNECTIIIIWVDDLIISASHEILLQSVKDSLSSKFRMKDLGVLSWFLGTEFKCSESAIEMSQKQYIEKLLLRFGMAECKPKVTPTVLGLDKVVDTKSPELKDPTLYRAIVGSLIYVMTDWGGDVCDRHSISGYGFQLLDEGPLVSWRSRKQLTVALSTCEAEYMALTDAVQEAKFLKQLCVDLHIVQVSYSVLVNGDNQGAINLAKNPMYHKRSKHIDVKYHFIRSEVRIGSIVLAYIPTDENVADIFTKPVSKVKLDKFGPFISGKYHSA
ncbi:Retrovirus-related Pol poly from transposon TNT 1-94 [Paramuricea clavata]|uniref:Retrovirus-related Pol poly from transposon TNT 1-94 n=1 Tax=Paramuricea clavata TaxID=317549 RepID=A0A6S7GVQ8_PARCT|nr:Retrovirus-related Pol poly from transposon TNT 1-94 [Paramuricea clavata]